MSEAAAAAAAVAARREPQHSRRLPSQRGVVVARALDPLDVGLVELEAGGEGGEERLRGLRVRSNELDRHVLEIREIDAVAPRREPLGPAPPPPRAERRAPPPRALGAAHARVQLGDLGAICSLCASAPPAASPDHLLLRCQTVERSGLAAGAVNRWMDASASARSAATHAARSPPSPWRSHARLVLYGEAAREPRALPAAADGAVAAAAAALAAAASAASRAVASVVRSVWSAPPPSPPQLPGLAHSAASRRAPARRLRRRRPPRRPAARAASVFSSRHLGRQQPQLPRRAKRPPRRRPPASAPQSTASRVSAAAGVHMPPGPA